MNNTRTAKYFDVMTIRRNEVTVARKSLQKGEAYEKAQTLRQQHPGTPFWVNVLEVTPEMIGAGA